jgi:hypothetical protein
MVDAGCACGSPNAPHRINGRNDDSALVAGHDESDSSPLHRIAPEMFNLAATCRGLFHDSDPPGATIERSG